MGCYSLGLMKLVKHQKNIDLKISENAKVFFVFDFFVVLRSKGGN